MMTNMALVGRSPAIYRILYICSGYVNHRVQVIEVRISRCVNSLQDERANTNHITIKQ